MPRFARPRVSLVAPVALAIALALPALQLACGTTPQGAVMLAMQTDMQVAEDINGVGVYIQTPAGKVLTSIYAKATLNGETNTRVVRLPATYAVVAQGGVAAQVRVRIIGFRSADPGKPDSDIGTPTVMNEALVTVPPNRQVLLPLGLSFVNQDTVEGPNVNLGLDGASVLATQAAGVTAVSPDAFKWKAEVGCKNPNDVLLDDGECSQVPNYQESDLPEFDEREVYGGGTSDGTGATCFPDARECLKGADLIQFGPPVVDPSTKSASRTQIGDTDLSKRALVMVLPQESDEDYAQRVGKCPLDRSEPCMVLVDAPNAERDRRFPKLARYLYSYDPARRTLSVRGRFAQQWLRRRLRVLALAEDCSTKLGNVPRCEQTPKARKRNGTGDDPALRAKFFTASRVGTATAATDIEVVGRKIYAVDPFGAVSERRLLAGESAPALSLFSIKADPGAGPYNYRVQSYLSQLKSALMITQTSKGMRPAAVAYSIFQDASGDPQLSTIGFYGLFQTPPKTQLTSIADFLSFDGSNKFAFLGSTTRESPQALAHRVLFSDSKIPNSAGLSDANASCSLTSEFAPSTAAVTSAPGLYLAGPRVVGGPLLTFNAGEACQTVEVDGGSATWSELGSKKSFVLQGFAAAPGEGAAPVINRIFVLVGHTGSSVEGTGIYELQLTASGGKRSFAATKLLGIQAMGVGEAANVNSTHFHNLVAHNGYVYFTYDHPVAGGRVSRLALSAGAKEEVLASGQANPRGLRIVAGVPASERGFVVWANAGALDEPDRLVLQTRGVQCDSLATSTEIPGCGGVMRLRIPK